MIREYESEINLEGRKPCALLKAKLDEKDHKWNEPVRGKEPPVKSSGRICTDTCCLSIFLIASIFLII